MTPVQRGVRVASESRETIPTLDPNYEKNSFENDSERASNPGANAPFVERDTAALTSEDEASQPADWARASPIKRPGSRGEI